MHLTVIIPAYNEQETVGRVIEGIPETMPGVSKLTVIVVDDGSDDRTPIVALQSGADYVYKHSRNGGVASAVKDGIMKALDFGADIIVNIDADGQFTPREIPFLILPILENSADLVLGSRFLASNNSTEIPAAKRTGNKIMSSLVSSLTGQMLHDTQCGFRAMNRNAAKQIRLSGIFTYTQEMILEAAFRGLRITEVPISVRYFPDRDSRVVADLPTYVLKVLGIIMMNVLYHLQMRILFYFSLLVLSMEALRASFR